MGVVVPHELVCRKHPAELLHQQFDRIASSSGFAAPRAWSGCSAPSHSHIDGRVEKESTLASRSLPAEATSIRPATISCASRPETFEPSSRPTMTDLAPRIRSSSGCPLAVMR